MFFLTKNKIKQIKDSCNIVDVISDFLTIEKAGQNYKTLCPFHNDHNPSLYISTKKQSYKCFVCNEGGDVLNFIEKYKKINFLETLLFLSKKYNLKDITKEIENRENKKIKLNENENYLFEINNEIKNYFLFSLYENKDKEVFLKKFLQKRNVTTNLINYFSLGYCSEENRKDLYNFLLKKGYSQEIIKKTGVFSNIGNTTIFNKNIIFPIFNKDGNIISFAGRTLIKQNNHNQKYINGRETNIFIKRESFYGFTESLNNKNFKNIKNFFLVEGYMDVISLKKINCHALALMGLNISEKQIFFLKKLKKIIYLFLDNDKNAEEALITRITQNFLLCGYDEKTLHIISSDKEGDPDELINKNYLKNEEEIIKKSKNIFKFIYKIISEKKQIEKLKYFYKMLCFASLPTKEVYLKKISDHFKIETKEIEKAFEKENYFLKNKKDKYNINNINQKILSITKIEEKIINILKSQPFLEKIIIDRLNYFINNKKIGNLEKELFKKINSLLGRIRMRKEVGLENNLKSYKNAILEDLIFYLNKWFLIKKKELLEKIFENKETLSEFKVTFLEKLKNFNQTRIEFIIDLKNKIKKHEK